VSLLKMQSYFIVPESFLKKDQVIKDTKDSGNELGRKTNQENYCNRIY